MLTISFRDLQKVSWLSDYNEVELLNIDRDDEVNKVLSEMGADLDYGTQYIAAQHRDMSGKIAVGFLAVADVSINRKHLTSQWATLDSILIASAYTDSTLTVALGELSCICRSYDQELSLDDTQGFVFPAEQVEPTWGDVAKQIAELNDLRDFVRGPMYAPCGSLKTPSQYKEYQQEQRNNNKGNN